MLTDKDLEWLNHLSDTNQVKIIPYNPKVKEIFAKQKKEIQQTLGQGVSVQHRGATNLGISGKGDIDIYIPTSKDQFDIYLNQLKSLLGEPGSLYSYERVRWNREDEGFEIEIFLMNKDHPAWLKSVAFEDYLLSHSEELEKYRKLKENAEGVSTREYYKRKIEFINDILERLNVGVF